MIDTISQRTLHNSAKHRNHGVKGLTKAKGWGYLVTYGYLLLLLILLDSAIKTFVNFILRDTNHTDVSHVIPLTQKLIHDLQDSVHFTK